MKQLLWVMALAAAPALAAPKPLPPEVQAMMPQNIVSLGTYELSPAPGAPKYLVHVWTAPRRNPNGSLFGRPNPYKGPISAEEVRSDDFSLFNSPFVLDIFSNPQHPKYEGSATYLDRHAPSYVSLSYFNSIKKQGLVFQVNSAWSNTNTDRFFVYENELKRGYIMDEKKISVSSGGGGYYAPGRSATGEFQVMAVGKFGGRSALTWNGREFSRNVGKFIRR